MKNKVNHHDHQYDFTGERMVPKLNKGFTFYYEHLLRYLFSTQFVKNKNILDLGSGTGYGSRILREMGGKKVHGIDISRQAIDYAQDLYQVSGLKYTVGDVENLPVFSDKFDTVIAFELLEHLANHDQFLIGIKKNLTKDGVFLVSTPNKYNYPKGNPFHINELYPDDFKKLLKRNFKFVYLFNQQSLFSHSLIPLDKKNDLNLNFIDENYTTTQMTSLSPEIDIKKSRYIIAVCCDQELKNINCYNLDSFQADEFLIEDGVEAMSASIKELKQSYDEITSSHFFKFWGAYNRIKPLVKKIVSKPK